RALIVVKSDLICDLYDNILSNIDHKDGENRDLLDIFSGDESDSEALSDAAFKQCSRCQNTFTSNIIRVHESVFRVKKRRFDIKYNSIDSDSDIELAMATTKPSQSLRLTGSDSDSDSDGDGDHDLADNVNLDPDKTLTSGMSLSSDNTRSGSDNSTLTDPSILADSDDAPADTSLGPQHQPSQRHTRSSSRRTMSFSASNTAK
ncbi:hypothetical protein CF326_g7136, partial [Tilletia indica]